MLNIKARSEMLSRTEEEIREEKAAALGRIGKKLEELLTKLQTPGYEDAVYKETRRLARLYYWYMIVQRESIGLRNHTELAKHYRIDLLR